MDRRWISEPARVHPPYTEPPKSKRNTLHALLILVAVALLSGAITSFLFLYFEQTITPPQEQTIIIRKGETHVSYPKTRTEAADRFGGNPKDWSKAWLIRGWFYMGDTPIEIPITRNVTVSSDNLLIGWQQAKRERSKAQ